jgi:hypothetical protein
MIEPPIVELHVFTWRLMIYAQYKLDLKTM